jgi:hypothetical protein
MRVVCLSTDQTAVLVSCLCIITWTMREKSTSKNSGLRKWKRSIERTCRTPCNVLSPRSLTYTRLEVTRPLVRFCTKALQASNSVLTRSTKALPGPVVHSRMMGYLRRPLFSLLPVLVWRDSLTGVRSRTIGDGAVMVVAAMYSAT